MTPVMLLLAAWTAASSLEQLPGTQVWRGRSAPGEVLAWDLTDLPPFDRAVVSWNVTGPAVVSAEAEGRAQVIARWGARSRSELPEQDTLTFSRPVRGLKVHIDPEPGAVVTLLAVTYWRQGDAAAPGRSTAAGAEIRGVPHLIQRDGSTCSPTSLAMILQHHGLGVSADQAAEGVRDLAPGFAFGNWTFNTAYAAKASRGRLWAYVRRMRSLAELEAEIAAGRPVAVSVKLPGSIGHIMVVRGFTSAGDVLVNDPGRFYARDQAVPRGQFHRMWLVDGPGTTYIVGRN